MSKTYVNGEEVIDPVSIYGGRKSNIKPIRSKKDRCKPLGCRSIPNVNIEYIKKRGKDGEDGEDGKDGDDGKAGEDGKDGEDGKEG